VAISGEITVTKGTLGIHLYSNDDIQRFGRYTLSTENGI
jgi:hypothetical protein